MEALAWPSAPAVRPHCAAAAPCWRCWWSASAWCTAFARCWSTGCVWAQTCCRPYATFSTSETLFAAHSLPDQFGFREKNKPHKNLKSYLLRRSGSSRRTTHKLLALSAGKCWKYSRLLRTVFRCLWEAKKTPQTLSQIAETKPQSLSSTSFITKYI